jgi:2-polyprenyl-6-methoxyphenol hydroxylase-like FAD-dependent oxidoreductase
VLDDDTSIESDLVVIAEGLRSRTRDLVMPVPVTELGMYTAFLTIPRQESDDRWWNWQHVPESRSIHLRPDNLGTTRAMLAFLSGVRGLEDLDRKDQIAILRRTFADAGGAAPRILAQLDDAPMYFDAIGQVRAPRWSQGRVALLGDAAFCPSPVGGGGSSLALIGAYVLAGELSRTDDVRSALTRYEQFMRPHVAAAQNVRPAMLRRANPRTRSGIRVLHAGARAIASPAVRASMELVGRRFGGGAAEGIRLPDYPPTET